MLFYIFNEFSYVNSRHKCLNNSFIDESSEISGLNRSIYTLDINFGVDMLSYKNILFLSPPLD